MIFWAADFLPTPPKSMVQDRQRLRSSRTRKSIVPIPLPTVTGEVEAHWNVIQLTIAIDVVDA